jgi:hypothetical protein
MSRRRRRHDDDDEILRDGERLHIPLTLMDSWQRDMAAHFGAYPAGPGTKEGGACTIDGAPGKLRKQSDGSFICVPDASTDAITTDTPAMVVDAYGGTDGLSRPGLRYLHAVHRSLDDAVLTTRRVMCDEARADYIQQTGDAWKKGTRREIEVKPITSGDTREAALAARDAELTNAWRGGNR